MLLKFLAITLGILIALTRGYGLLFPTKMKQAVTRLVSNPSALRILGIMLFVFASLIFIALGRNISGLRLVMLFFGISILSGASVLTFRSKRYIVLVGWFMNLPEPSLRILYGIGLALGVLLTSLGIFYY